MGPFLGLVLFAGAATCKPPPEPVKVRKEAVPKELEGATITEKPGAQVPAHLEFVDSKGNKVRIGDYVDGKRPVILTLNYYGCPMLCGLQLNGLLEGLKEMKWTAGDEFEIVTVSFDPGETPILAKNKKQTYLKEYRRAAAADGWHFLTGRQKNIEQLTDSVGYGYAWNERRKEYAHEAGLMILSPDGKVSRYLYGVLYDPRTLRLSLVEAAEGKTFTSPLDRLFLFCFHYDAIEGRYAVAAMNVMTLGGFVTMSALGIFLFVLWRAESRRNFMKIEGQQA